MSNVTETTIDLNLGLDQAQARRLKWRSSSGVAGGEPTRGHGAAPQSPSIVTFDAELIRSYTFAA